jgi:hypothetical protein
MVSENAAQVGAPSLSSATAVLLPEFQLGGKRSHWALSVMVDTST